MALNLIVALRYDDDAIGKKSGELLWSSAEDMAHFKKITVGNGNNIVIMGRKTHQSIKRLLPNRLNYIIGSRFHKKIPGGYYFSNFNEALTDAFSKSPDNIFVIGGGEIYDYVMKNYENLLSRAWLTEFDIKITEKEDDLIYFNRNLFKNLFEFSKSYQLCENATVLEYNYKNHDEKNYLNLIEKILYFGSSRQDRTNVGTISIFGERLEFDLSRFPLLTTKKMGYKTILRELLWFLSGSTNSKILEQQNVNIWKGNSSREFLDSRGLNFPEGDVGALYSFQWRHFGAEYIDCNTDYTNKGFDQIKYIINLIKTDPNSRRIMMSAWNPSDFDKMSIFPCHVSAQFFVNEGKLDCQMYQRSADTMLGVPFNIASYAFLVYMIGHLTNLKPGRLLTVFGDTHIYNNHIPGAKEQIKRTPYRFPRLILKRNVTDIDDFKLEDFEIVDYNSEPAIKLEMAV